MKSLRIILAVSILLLIPISGSAADKTTPFAAWTLPGDRLAYLTPNDETKLRVIDSKGKFLGSYIGEVGKGGIIMPWDMAGSPDGWLFILDRMKAKVNVYDDNFEFQYSIGEKGSGQGQLKSPQAIALDSYGFLYVANNGNNTIEKFNVEGKHVGTLRPESGEGVGTEFKYVTAIAATPDGKLAVAVDADDPILRRKVFVYNREGDLFGVIEMLKWGGQGKFTDLFIDRDDTLFLVDTPGDTGAYPGSVWHINKDGTLIKMYQAYDPGFGRYYSPLKVLVSDGELFIFCVEKQCLVYSLDEGYLYSFGI
jgi:hypothetical protein